ncbi:MAG TPA: hypothetical protein VHD81_11075 [Mycobacteriales bacterium]|nr:hypothetical protein [Mycobacteriales bacterium]
MTHAVGFVPAAPLLVPQVAGGSAHLDAELRGACREVAKRLVGVAAAAITVVAPVATAKAWPAEATWGFEGFGVPRRPADPRPRLPWSLGIGDWLLDDIGWTGARNYVGVSDDGSAPSAASGDALLVVGDGSARRTEKAPGHLDDRAEGFDASIAAAIRDGNVAALGGLDPELAADLLCAGAPVWRWVANAIGSATVTESELLADTAPYGVGYFTGWWRLSR